MKIEWLNAELTEAIITRGIWWWKIGARVVRDLGNKVWDSSFAWSTCRWNFAETGRALGYGVCASLENERDRVSAAVEEQKYSGKEWFRVKHRLPKATLLLKGRGAPL